LLWLGILAILNRLPDNDDELLPAGSTSERTAALRASVAALTGRGCALCGKILCGHEALFAILLGSRHAPRCASCAAREHREPRADLCERSLHWILRRDCFLAAWRGASEAEGFGTADRPACTFDRVSAGAPHSPTRAALAADGPPLADAVFDARDLGCGDLVIELKFKFAEMAPGAVLEVCATDPAAHLDLPAWCGLVGHTLLHASPPRYWIRRKQPS